MTNSSKKMTGLEKLLNKQLSIKSDTTASRFAVIKSVDSANGVTTLKNELKKMGFEIFEPISGHGYFKWKTSGDCMTLTSTTTINQLIDHIQLDKKPNNLVCISNLKLPFKFKNLPPRSYIYDYPNFLYGGCDIAGLYVASKQLGVKMNEVEFVFNSSALEMFAQQDLSNSNKEFLSTVLPTTNTFIIVSRDEHDTNYVSNWCQFKPFVTGMNFSDKTELEFFRQVHLMKVGQYKVLFHTDTDAMHEGKPIKVNTCHPKRLGTKKVFQRISYGCTKFCHGLLFKDEVKEVRILNLSQVAKYEFQRQNINFFEKNIVNGMKSLKEQMINAKDGEVYKINFKDGKLILQLEYQNESDLVPPENIIKEIYS